MARQAGPNFFTGRKGNEIGYEVDGEYFVRTAPLKVDRSDATKKAADDFGTACQYGGRIRHALQNVLYMPYDSSLVNRLNKIMLSILNKDDVHDLGKRKPLLRNYRPLLNFSMNEFCSLPQVLSVKPAIHRDAKGNIIVTIPPFLPKNALNIFKGTTHLAIIAFALKPDGLKPAAVSAPLLLPVNVKAGYSELKVHYPARDQALLMLEVVQLEEVNGSLYDFKDRTSFAADIIGILPTHFARKMKIIMQDSHTIPQKSAPTGAHPSKFKLPAPPPLE